ncbi:GNAT family N-acetyltransferase [Peptoniphilaceae bacterium SGI.131]
MEIIREDYYIRPLKFEDGRLLAKWGNFQDPLLAGYNYNDLSEEELRTWYRVKQRFYRASYFSILDKEENLIGYLGLKEINKFLKTAKLGIVFNPDMVSKGYGKRVMVDFLAYYFRILGMRRLDLNVNAWNFRARRLYEALGFTYKKDFFEKFENQDLPLEDEAYADIREYFDLRGDQIYSKILRMSLTDREYRHEI